MQSCTRKKKEHHRTNRCGRLRHVFLKRWSNLESSCCSCHFDLFVTQTPGPGEMSCAQVRTDDRTQDDSSRCHGKRQAECPGEYATCRVVCVYFEGGRCERSNCNGLNNMRQFLCVSCFLPFLLSYLLQCPATSSTTKSLTYPSQKMSVNENAAQC